MGSTEGPEGSTAEVADGLPMEKVNAPEIGWPSAETTRQETV